MTAGTEQNLQTAFQYFMRAANLGLAEAQYVVGLKYYRGEGVEMVSGLLRNFKMKVYKKIVKSIFTVFPETEKELYDTVTEFMEEIENA